MKIVSYQKLQIETLPGTSPDADVIVQRAIRITQKLSTGTLTKADPEVIKFLLTANHTSIFEHCTFQCYITGMSRSLQMQLVRHRMGSFTMSSQHYQDSRDYDMIVHPELMHNSILQDTLIITNSNYEKLIDQQHVKPEEARQILPQAKGSHGLWTVNARSLINFLNLRLCKRNVDEMIYFAKLIHKRVHSWFPQLFKHVHADCIMLKECRQKHLSCGKPYQEGETTWL